jgi:L-ectoine synthase
MGFSYNDNRIAAGSEMTLWCKHHWEANVILSGRGEVQDLTSGRTWALGPGVLYVVGPNDRHRLHLTEATHLVSVFCPALRDDERHDADGAYPASGPVPRSERRVFVRSASEMRAAGKEMTVAERPGAHAPHADERDGVGFSFSDVHLGAGAEATLWYKRHWEANHIVSGAGRVTDVGTGQAWKLEPGLGYNVGPKGLAPAARRYRAAPSQRLLPADRRARAARRGWGAENQCRRGPRGTEGASANRRRFASMTPRRTRKVVPARSTFHDRPWHGL